MAFLKSFFRPERPDPDARAREIAAEHLEQSATHLQAMFTRDFADVPPPTKDHHTARQFVAEFVREQADTWAASIRFEARELRSGK